MIVSSSVEPKLIMEIFKCYIMSSRDFVFTYVYITQHYIVKKINRQCKT
jgi:hypothetical protein